MHDIYFVACCCLLLLMLLMLMQTQAREPGQISSAGSISGHPSTAVNKETTTEEMLASDTTLHDTTRLDKTRWALQRQPLRAIYTN